MIAAKPDLSSRVIDPFVQSAWEQSAKCRTRSIQAVQWASFVFDLPRLRARGNGSG